MISYIVLLILGGLFIQATLNTEEVKVAKEKKETHAEEVKPAKVTLNVQNGQSYTMRLKNVDSVLDLLEELRSTENFWYEKTAYTYGTELDMINHQDSPEGYSWRVFLNDKDITYEIGKWNLNDQDVYELKLVESKN